MKSKKPASPSPDYWHWWNESKEFNIVSGFDEAIPGLEDWYDVFWNPYRVSAWAYELVRRLQSCPRVPLSPDERAWIRQMPPYPKLSRVQKDSLRYVIARTFQRPLVLLNEGGVTPSYPDYSTSIKPWSFDLTAHETDLREFFLAWIQEEKQRLGIENKQGPKGRSRNRDQSEKLGNWRQVELLELPYGEVQKRQSQQTQDPYSQRKEIIATARRYVTDVVDAWNLASLVPLMEFPPIMYCPSLPRLHGMVFSREEVDAVIKRVVEESPKPAG